MKRVLPLLIILAIATFFRFWQLDRIPPSLSHDEVAIGYNAYSILKTGKDEYGTPWPLLFRSFDDYKLPGMVYATIPSIVIFGLNEWGVRFPSAIMGVLAVIIMYFLTQELCRKWEVGKEKLHTPFLTSLLLALSPWHINFSRQSFESNGAVFFALTGFLFLLRSRQKINHLITSLLFFALSLYFYYSVRLVIPFVLVTYILLYKNHLRNHFRIAIIAFTLFIVVSSPILAAMATGGGTMRLRIVSVLNDPNYIRRSERLVSFAQTLPQPFGSIIFNRRLALPITIADNYWKNISPKQIFIAGTTTYGLQHPFELPLMVLGLTMLLSFTDPAKWMVIAWLISAVFPGAFSLNQPNALRTLLNAPMFSLLSGIGLAAFVVTIDKRKRFTYFVAPFTLFLLFTLYQFGNAYFIANADINARAFGDGHKQMVTYVAERKKQYERVVITGNYWRPYIYTLFWTKYNPTEYQKNGSPESFGNYYFTAADWDKSGISLLAKEIDLTALAGTNPTKTLFVLSPAEYDRHRERLIVRDSISGVKVQNMFIAAILKN